MISERNTATLDTYLNKSSTEFYIEKNYFQDVTHNGHTPEVSFKDKTLTISGNSYPQDSTAFYIPLLNRFRKSLANGEIRTINMLLDGFNTASSKQFLDLFYDCEQYLKNSPDVELMINWYYNSNDQNMHEAGREYCEYSGLPFKFIQRAENKNE